MLPIQRPLAARHALLNRHMLWRYVLFDGVGLATGRDTLDGRRAIAPLFDLAHGTDDLQSARAVHPHGLAHGSDAVVVIRHATQVLADRASGADALTRGALQSLADLARGSDALLPTRKTLAFFDLAQGTDTITAAVQTVVLLSDLACGADQTTQSVRAIAFLADLACGSDQITLGTNSGISAVRVLAVNVDTGAVSEYAWAVQVDSAAKIEDNFLLATPTGLYALDASTDDGQPVAWRVQTGFSNFGSDAFKRLGDVNLQLRTTGGVAIETITDRLGEKQIHSFALPPLPRESYRDGVVKIGKGVQSVYWGLAVTGQGPAEIDHLIPTFIPLSRRR